MNSYIYFNAALLNFIEEDCEYFYGTEIQQISYQKQSDEYYLTINLVCAKNVQRCNYCSINKPNV